MASRFHPFYFLLFFPSFLLSQNFAGQWKGELTQEDKTDQYIYQIELEQHENRVSGTAISQKKSGGTEAEFVIGGSWDGATLTLQEVQQTKPEGARWCLKHIRLKYDEEKQELKGSWEAEGCKPGWMSLQSTVHSPQSTTDASAAPLTLSPSQTLTLSPSQTLTSLPGHWVGHLSQNDRDYGFYFEMDLAADGTGTSRITSDGEGGNALHHLEWEYNEEREQLIFNELSVAEKSVETWQWCIKSGELFFAKEKNRLSLRGKWGGFIEGHDAATGACAPGTLYLERPIIFPEENKDDVSQKQNLPEAKTTPAEVKKYEDKKERQVKVDRVLEVKNKTVKVAVWDNGTVDGDVLSLFVNGEMILENYRVSRRKHVTIVKLDKPTNYLILHAINLGSITPNTVAVSVDDGHEEQIVIMSSNLKESGAIMLREFRVE